MAQGGFARDYQRAAAAKMKKAQEDLEKERQVIGKQVTNNILPNLRIKLDEQVKQVEDKLVLKQDEIVDEFIQISHARNRLLKFLLVTNFITLSAVSFGLGYFL
tara:strand:- start:7411 stop:7722 length:312 start_codon:yes stop_codon:yes gene_type:complete